MWEVDWAWGLPMLLALIAFHVCGLVGIEALLRWFESRRKKPRSIAYFLGMMLLTANAVLGLHILEVGAWAHVYMDVGAIDGLRAAWLYSLNAITSYGHEGTRLADKWKLLGAIESMNGVMIFGLTTAFLFNAMSELRPVRRG